MQIDPSLSSKEISETQSMRWQNLLETGPNLKFEKKLKEIHKREREKNR